MALGTSSCAKSQAAGRAVTPAEWKQDLAALARELPRRHASAFHNLSSATFASAVAQLQVGYSTKLYKFQSEDTPGVLPDHRVETSWADVRAGRDAVLEWLLAQPRVAK